MLPCLRSAVVLFSLFHFGRSGNEKDDQIVACNDDQLKLDSWKFDNYELITASDAIRDRNLPAPEGQRSTDTGNMIAVSSKSADDAYGKVSKDFGWWNFKCIHVSLIGHCSLENTTANTAEANLRVYIGGVSFPVKDFPSASASPANTSSNWKLKLTTADVSRYKEGFQIMIVTKGGRGNELIAISEVKLLGSNSSDCNKNVEKLNITSIKEKPCLKTQANNAGSSATSANIKVTTSATTDVDKSKTSAKPAEQSSETTTTSPAHVSKHTENPAPSTEEPKTRRPNRPDDDQATSSSPASAGSTSSSQRPPASSMTSEQPAMVYETSSHSYNDEKPVDKTTSQRATTSQRREGSTDSPAGVAHGNATEDTSNAGDATERPASRKPPKSHQESATEMDRSAGSGAKTEKDSNAAAATDATTMSS